MSVVICDSVVHLSKSGPHEYDSQLFFSFFFFVFGCFFIFLFFGAGVSFSIVLPDSPLQDCLSAEPPSGPPPPQGLYKMSRETKCVL